MAVGQDPDWNYARLLAEADQRTVQEVGGGSKGITLDPDSVELGDQVFIDDDDDDPDGVYKLITPEALK